ncbi:MAG: hydroxyphenylacetyl-CoA thioesterase PaaI [Gammaproteobacteria bacterium]
MSDANERARESARLMMADDRASQHLGITLLEVAPGRARMRMTVRPEFANGHGVCHGGYIFLLADTAFAFACNSHNQRAVAAGASIEFLAPAHEGDVLTAEGVERHLAGRHGVYDIEVSDQDGRRIALFRGKSATIKGRFFEEAS